MPQTTDLKILGIVPARKGSKRVPGKNTKLLAGLPLIEFALRAAEKSRFISRLVVSSDDEGVQKIVAQYPAISFIRRPDELATDVSPAIEYVKHVLLQAAETPWDIVVIIQPTTPFVTTSDIDATIELLIKSGARTSVSVVKLEQMHHPFKLKVMDGNRLLPFIKDEGSIKAAHELPDVYSRNGGVYASTIETIRDGIIIGEPCVGHVMPYERSVDINYPIDFDFAEFLASKYHFEP